MTREERKDFQRTLNAFTSRYLHGVNPLHVDGVFGFATNRRVLTVEWYLGMDADRIKNLGDQYATNATVRRELVRRLRHPRDPQYVPSPTRTVRLAVVARGIRRRRAQYLRYKRNLLESYVVPGVTRWEGKPVAKAAVYFLNKARDHGWVGGLNSGWRDPLYSEKLCYIICGAPSCSGTCAGRSSAHSGSTPQHFAIDVSGYTQFGQIMHTIPVPAGLVRIYNDLPKDPVHYSPTGH